MGLDLHKPGSQECGVAKVSWKDQQKCPSVHMNPWEMVAKMGFGGSGNKHIQLLRWALVGNLCRGPGENCRRVVGRSKVSWGTHRKCGVGCRHDMGVDGMDLGEALVVHGSP